MRSKLFAILALLLYIVILFASIPSTALSSTFQADSRYADSYLANVFELERNEITTYHWTSSSSALMLSGFERLPVILDLYLTSPRPIDEPRADLGLGRGRWLTERVAVSGDWRHYHLLVPASGFQPELSLISTTFRPDSRNDKRNLGIALSQVQISVPALINPKLAGILALGPWRIVLLLLYPLILYTSVLRLAAQHSRSTLLALLIACVGAVPAILLAHNPIQTARLAPDAWRLPLLGTMLLLLWLCLRPWLRTVEQGILYVLNHDRLRLRIVLGITAIFGIIMIFAVPVWEQQDEGAHFEFAWLIANHPTWPVPGTSDPRMAITNGNGRALYHQPLYYMLVSLVLRLVPDWPIPQQLILARCVSLVLLLGTLWSAERTTRAIFPQGHVLRWFVPLSIVLNPTFTYTMTGVNNDVGVTFVCSIAILIATQILMQGLTWSRLLLLLGTIPLAMAVKDTGVILLVIVPIVISLSLQRKLRLSSKWFLVPFGMLVIFLSIILGWSDPAHWYRWQSASGGPAMRVERPDAPLGSHVLRMDAVATPNFEGLSSPLSNASVVANHQVTVGAWVWANRPARIWAPGVLYQLRENEDRLTGDHRVIDVTTQPQWIATTYQIPGRILFVHMMAWSVAPQDQQALEIYIDGAVMVKGVFPTYIAPQFDDNQAQRGIWAGSPFINLIQNGDFEQGWVFLRPEVQNILSNYIRRSPARVIASFADPIHTLALEIHDYIPWLMFMSLGIYGRSILREDIWQYLLPGLCSAALIGVLWLMWKERERRDDIAFTYRTLGLISLCTWLSILIAHLPVNFPGGFPSTRYGFTMIIPSALLLCMGWLALWPTTLRYKAAIALLMGWIMISIAAISTIFSFQNSACIRVPGRCLFSPAPDIMGQPTLLALFGLLILLFGLVHWYARRNVRARTDSEVQHH